MNVPSNDNRPMARLDLAWIGEAWRLFTEQPGAWIGAVALYIVTFIVVLAVAAVPTGVYTYFVRIFQAIESTGGVLPADMTSHREIFRFLPFSLIMASFESILNGGLYRMAIRQYRGESINAAGVFSAFNVAWQLIVLALMLEVINVAVSFVPLNIGWLVDIVLVGFFFLAPIRIVDKSVGPIQALMDNLSLLRGQRWLGLFLYILIYLMLFVGGCCVVGLLVTLPLFCLAQGVSYMMMTDPRQPVAPEYGQSIPGVWPPPPNLGP
jgi:hypothetical protein